MSAGQVGNRILVLCDSDELAKSLAESLSVGLEVVSCTPLSIDKENIHSRVDCLDMIVVVASLPASEPAAMLFEASLLNLLGHTPMLIMSHRRCYSEAGDKMYHMSFPCDESVLYERIVSILWNGHG